MKPRYMQPVIVKLALFVLLLCASFQANAQSGQNAKRVPAIVTEDCLDWGGNVFIITLEVPGQAKLTIHLWGKLYADFKEGKPITIDAQPASLYHDVSGKTGEATLCDADGICKPASIKLDLPFADEADGTISAEGLIFHARTSNNNKKVICG